MKQRKDNRTEYSGRQRAVRKPGREAGGESGRSLARSGKKSGKKTELKRKQTELTELARSGEKSGIKPGQPGRHVSGSRQVWRGGNMLYPVPAGDGELCPEGGETGHYYGRMGRNGLLEPADGLDLYPAAAVFT